MFPAWSWSKSSYSGTQTNCVEVASVPALVGVRDTKDRDSGALLLRGPAWQALVARV